MILSKYKIALLLLSAVCFHSSLSYAQADFNGDPISGSEGFHGYVWYKQRNIEFEKNVLCIPTKEEIQNLAVEWNPPTIDLLERFCVISGTLRTQNEKGLLKPIHWQQMIGVHIAVKPGSTPDWSRGTDFRTAMGDAVMVQENGTFEVRFDLRDCKPRLTNERNLQIGISLAKQTVIDGQTLSILYESSAPVLDQSLAVVTIPLPSEVSPIVRAIAEVASFPSDDANALDLIRVSNRLRDLGKDEALKAMEEYRKLSLIDGSEYQTRILYALGICIFEPADPEDQIPFSGSLPQFLPGVDLENNNNPNVRHDWPRLPIEIYSNCPWVLGSDFQDILFDSYTQFHLRWFRNYAVLRETPLKPVEDPFETIEQLLREPKFKKLEENTYNDVAKNLKRQVYSMVRHLYPPLPLDDVDEPEIVAYWELLRSKAKTSGLHWNTEAQAYQFKKQ